MVYFSNQKRGMHHPALFLFALTIVFADGALVFAADPQNGRFADLKASAFQAFDKGRYAEVAGRLEEIWEEDQSDAKVAEYLAMGYLYGERDLSKAQPLLEKAIALGGQATFLVIHSHEHLSMLRGDVITDFCTGKLSITPGKISFLADSGEHTLNIPGTELKEFSILGGSPGRIHIKTLDRGYVFRVKTQTRSEAVLLGRLAEQNLKR